LVCVLGGEGGVLPAHGLYGVVPLSCVMGGGEDEGVSR
jgi:hypothetical protein